MIQCSDMTFYTGITNDLAKRFGLHCTGKGAKYFRFKQPLRVVYAEDGFDRSSANKRECAIKKLRRNDKLSLIKSDSNQIARLFPDFLESPDKAGFKDDK